MRMAGGMGPIAFPRLVISAGLFMKPGFGE